MLLLLHQNLAILDSDVAGQIATTTWEALDAAVDLSVGTLVASSSFEALDAGATLAVGTLVCTGPHGSVTSGAITPGEWTPFVVEFNDETRVYLGDDAVVASSSGGSGSISSGAQFKVGPSAGTPFELARLHVITHAGPFSDDFGPDAIASLQLFLEEPLLLALFDPIGAMGFFGI